MKTTTATTQNTPRVFDTDRKHGVGQFLRAHPEALRVMKRLAEAQRGIDSIGAHLKSKGYAA